ncbi:MAG: hypothetical protein MJ172_09730 [Clostridia bacterium]|nr:hypothetical protein [Clostridia bacterium]
MEVVKVSKKFREVCYEIMDGSYDSVEKLELFEEYPHQVNAVKAAIAFFDKDYDTAIDFVDSIMPYWDEWYYANAFNEYLTAAAFASKEIKREDFVREMILKEQDRLLSSSRESCEAGKNQRYNFCKIILEYLESNLLPKSKQELDYCVSEDAKSVEELISSMKLKDDTMSNKIKLYNMVCMKGLPEDAVQIYEKIEDSNLSEMHHENAIIRYLYLNQDEKALEAIERLATARLWTVAGPTQVRPMNFFTHPMMHKFLLDDLSLERIKKASFIDNGMIKRK